MGSNNLYESLLSEIKAINSFLVTLFRLNNTFPKNRTIGLAI